MRKKNSKRTKILSRMLELPEEVVTNKPKLTLVGFGDFL